MYDSTCILCLRTCIEYVSGLICPSHLLLLSLSLSIFFSVGIRHWNGIYCIKTIERRALWTWPKGEKKKLITHCIKYIHSTFPLQLKHPISPIAEDRGLPPNLNLWPPQICVCVLCVCVGSFWKIWDCYYCLWCPEVIGLRIFAALSQCWHVLLFVCG